MNKLQKLLCIGTGIFALSFGSCSKDFSMYNYNGHIGDEFVKFESTEYGGLFWDEVDLTVIDSRGKVTRYIDYFEGDLKLDEVQITNNGKKIHYFDNLIGKNKIKEFQKQFDNYLQEILKTKEEEGLDSAEIIN